MGRKRYESTRLTFEYPESWKVRKDGVDFQLLTSNGGALIWSTSDAVSTVGPSVERYEQRLEGRTEVLSEGRMVVWQWTLLRLDVVVQVSYVASTEVAAADREAVDQVIASALPSPLAPAGSDRPPRSRSRTTLTDGDRAHAASAFVAEVVERARRALKTVEVEARGLALVIDGDKQFSLEELFKTCLDEPGQRAARLEEFVELLRSHRKMSVIAGSWGIASGRVLPLLVEASQGDERATVPLCEGLSVSFGVDLGSAMAAVTPEMIAAWGTTLAEVRDRSVANLTSRPAAASVEARRGIQVVQLQQWAFATGLLLVPDLYERITSQLGTSLAVAVPGREQVFVARLADRARLRQIARAEHDRAAHPLTPNLFQMGPGTLEPLDHQETSWIKRMLGSG